MPVVQIGGWQLFTILVNMVFGKAIGYSSQVMTRQIGHDSWISMILAFVTGLAVITVVVWLARRFPKEKPTQYVPKLLGRPLGAVALLLLAAFFLGSYVTSSITVEQHLNDYLMTETPFLVFVLIYTAVTVIGAYQGLEVTARLSIIGFLLVILLDVLMMMGSIQHFEVRRMLPVFDVGVWPVVSASTGAAPDVAMAIGAALVLLPLVGQPKNWMRLTWWGLLAGMVTTVVWTIFEIGVMGAEATSQYLIACMQMARAAELSIYLHRYELIMVVLWLYSVVVQSVVTLYAATEMIQEVFHLKRGRLPLLMILGMVMAVPQYFLGRDRDVYGLFLDGVWPMIVIPIAYGLPLLFALVALFRTRGRQPAQAAEQG